MQRALHASRLLLPAAGERPRSRAAGAGWGAVGRGPRACGLGAVSQCVCLVRVLGWGGGALESRNGRAEPAPAGRAVSLCALLARRSPVPECALCARPRPASRPGLHASGPHSTRGLLLGGALWDCGWLGWGVCPGLVYGSIEVPAVCFSLDRLFARVSLLLGFCLLVSAPVSVSHKSLCPCVCVSPGFSLVCL